jgi:hypothetical protein
MIRSALRVVAAVATLATVSASVTQAQIFTGTTVGGPTWNRPLGGTPPTPPASTVGTATRYQALTFTVSSTGLYDLLSVATNPVNWDNYTHLYVTAFDPLNQFTNILRGNDDFPNIGRSGFSGVSLTAGLNYIFVTSGFANADFGAYELRISGPGTATLVNSNVVPEPSTYALMATGLVGLVGVARRRRVQR